MNRDYSKYYLILHRLIILGAFVFAWGLILHPQSFFYHDSFFKFKVFDYFTQTLHLNGTPSFWTAFRGTGINIGYYYGVFLSPINAISGWIAVLLSSQEPQSFMLAFKISLVMEVTIFLVGILLLIQEMTVSKADHIFLLYLFYLLPYSLLLLIRAINLKNPKYLLFSFFPLAGSQIGNIPYFLPIYLAWGLVSLVLYIIYSNETIKMPTPRPALYTLGLFGIAGIVYCLFFLESFKAISLGARDSPFVEIFKNLSHARIDLSKVAFGMLRGSNNDDYPLYIGYLSAFLLPTFIMISSSKSIKVIKVMFTGSVLLASGGGISYLIFSFPAFAIFRHINYLLTLSRVLLLIGIAYSLGEIFLKRKLPSPGQIIAGMVLVDFLHLSGFPDHLLKPGETQGLIFVFLSIVLLILSLFQKKYDSKKFKSFSYKITVAAIILVALGDLHYISKRTVLKTPKANVNQLQNALLPPDTFLTVENKLKPVPRNDLYYQASIPNQKFGVNDFTETFNQVRRCVRTTSILVKEITDPTEMLQFTARHDNGIVKCDPFGAVLLPTEIPVDAITKNMQQSIIGRPEVIHLQPEMVEYRVNNLKQTPITLVAAINPDPRWKLFDNGEPLKYEALWGNGIKVTIPTGIHSLVFQYNSTKLFWLFVILNIFGLFFIAATLYFSLVPLPKHQE